MANPNRDEKAIDEASRQLDSMVEDLEVELGAAGMSPSEVASFFASRCPGDPNPRVCGVPTGEIVGVTLDGRRWLEVLGEIHYEVRPGTGTAVITFRVAQAPGGKGRKDGIGQGDLISTWATRVLGVMRHPRGMRSNTAESEPTEISNSERVSGDDR